MIQLIAFLILSALAAWTNYRFGIKYSYVDVKDYAFSLLALSGMIFTIMGIWIAFIYPNAILRLQAPNKIKTADFSETLADTKRLESIVACVLKSALVASTVCLILFLKITLSWIPQLAEYTLALKSMLLGIVVLLTLVQGSAVASVVYANLMFVEELHTRRERKEGDDDF